MAHGEASMIKRPTIRRCIILTKTCCSTARDEYRWDICESLAERQEAQYNADSHWALLDRVERDGCRLESDLIKTLLVYIQSSSYK